MKTVISLLLLSVGVTTYGQRHMKSEFMPMMSHSIGGSFQQFNGLNDRIGNFPQYEALKDFAATLGLGWIKEQHRVISNAGVMVGSSMSGNHDKKSSTIRYAGVNADIGYDLVKDEKVMLYPMAGLGLQGYQALFYKDNSAVPFDDILTSPAVQNNISSVRFNNAFVVYRFGFGISVKSPKYPATMGIQAGYTGSFKSNAWKSKEGQQLSGAPVDKVSQFYVSLVFASKPMFMH